MAERVLRGGWGIDKVNRALAVFGAAECLGLFIWCLDYYLHLQFVGNSLYALRACFLLYGIGFRLL